MAIQIQIRRDTAANWASNDPIPAQGEICFEFDTNVFKIGDGLTVYSLLTAVGVTDHTALSNIGVNTHAQIDTHIADGTVHFTEASVDHTNISNVGANTHSAIDIHIADGTVHFTEASVDHTNITNVGTNTHVAIDTHIADGTIHVQDGTGIVAPTVNEDSGDGFSTSSIFIDTVADVAYICADATLGAAVWVQVGSGGGAGHTIQDSSVSLTARTNLNFDGALAATDDAGNDQTDITITQASLDHGSIGGLVDDDHSQYILVTGTRDFTGPQVTQDLVPNANTNDIGSTSTGRYDRIVGGIGVFVKKSLGGNANVTFPADPSQGGIVAGTQSGASVQNIHILEGNSFPAVACIGNTAASGGGIATMRATRGGAVCFGSSYVYGSSPATVSSGGFSSFTAGYAYGQGTSLLEATASGSVALGYANGQASASSCTIRSSGAGSFITGFHRSQSSTTMTATASGNGSFCAGNSQISIGSNIGTMLASGNGSFVQGAIRDGMGGSGGATMVASGVGSFTQGYARNRSSVLTSISSTGRGSFAQGYAYAATSNNAQILSSGFGSFAQGFADESVISATANNAVQFGIGTNAVADSLQVGGNFRANASGQHAGARETITLGAAATTFAIASQSIEVTGDAGANTIATITGGIAGQFLALQFVDALVTITDDNTQAANSVDLSAAFTSADDTMLFLFYDGVSWLEISRSIN